jgi:hypothetical protein
MNRADLIEYMITVSRLLAHSKSGARWAIEAFASVPDEVFDAMDTASGGVHRAMLTAYVDEKFALLGHETRGSN